MLGVSRILSAGGGGGGGDPVIATSLTSGFDATDGSEFTTESISPTANRLVLASVISMRSPSAQAPTLVGNGLTWVQVSTSIGEGGTRRLTVFRGMGTPSAGTVVISTGPSHLGMIWSITEFENVDTGGVDGADAVVQSVALDAAAQSSPFAITLAPFGDVNNATFGAFGLSAEVTMVEGAGFTELHELDMGTEAPLTTLQTEWKDENDTSVDVTYSGDQDMFGVAIEIKAAPAAGGVSHAVSGRRMGLSS